MLGSNAEGCTIGETSISEDRKGHFVLVQVEGLELFHDSEKGRYGTEHGIGRCPNKSTRLTILAILLFTPSEFCSVYKVRLRECCNGQHLKVVLTPEFHVVPDECSDVTKLVHDDLSIIVLGPFSETGANVDGKDAPIIHDIVDIMGCGTIALNGSVLDHVHCEWFMPFGHFLPSAYFVGDIGNEFGRLSSGQIDSGIQPNWMLCDGI